MSRVSAIIIIFILFYSCSIKKVSNTSSLMRSGNSEGLIKNINTINEDIELMSLKGSIKLIKEEKQASFNINIKYRKDSLIWASIRAPLGVELFRIQITNDSVYFMNRIAKKYLVEPISIISDYLNINMSFNDIKEILTATPARFKNEDKIEVEPEEYIVRSENIQYKIRKDKLHLSEIIKLEKDDTRLICNFLEFKEISGETFPYKFLLKIEPDNMFFLEMKYTRVIFNEKQKFSFKIPSHYEKTK